jgi:hypothetical protein
MERKMKVKTIQIGLLAIAFVFTITQICEAQLTAQEKWEREIKTMLKPGMLQFLPGETLATIEELAYIDGEISSILEANNAELILVAYPNADPADTIDFSPEDEIVKKLDLTRIFIVRFPTGSNLDIVVDELRNLPTKVVFAQRTPILELAYYPDDEFFDLKYGLDNYGNEDAMTDADIDAREAWDIHTGTYNDTIGIIDSGIDRTNEDLFGKVKGDNTYQGGHGTHVAGIAAAKTNNQVGIAGVEWAAILQAEDASLDEWHIDPGKIYDAVISCVSNKCNVTNNSWGGYIYDYEHRGAFAYAYKMGLVTVAAMGNHNVSDPLFPAAYAQGIIAVGATDAYDLRYTSGNYGNHIDCVAPGVLIYSTLPGISSYGYKTGTSMATPFVTGLAGLLHGYRPTLRNDDIEQIINMSCDKLPQMNGNNWTQYFGHGRINARWALDIVRHFDLIHFRADGGSSVGSVWKQVQFLGVPGLPDGTYFCWVHDVRKNITFPGGGYTYVPDVWGRGIGTKGYSFENPNFAMGWCSVDNITQTGCQLKTYVYDVRDIYGSPIGWFPCEPQDVSYRYTVLERPKYYTTVRNDFEGSPGGEVDVNWKSYSSPKSFTTAQYPGTVIGTASPQSHGGDDYYFTYWSNGAQQYHTITPGDAITYTAYFSKWQEPKWFASEDIPTRRYYLGVASARGKLYAIGGRSNFGKTNVVEEYDPQTNSWMPKQSMPEAREAFACEVLGNLIYCIGGLTSTGYSDEVRVYNPATNQWIDNVPKLPEPKAWAGSCVLNGKIYVIGGFGGYSTGGIHKIEILFLLISIINLLVFFCLKTSTL